MQIILDEGYFFGLGAFETIAVVDGLCILLQAHLERLQRALTHLQIERHISPFDLQAFLAQQPMQTGVLKVAISAENTVLTFRENPYTEAQYAQGFVLGISPVLRNETSPLTYLKSLNYGDNMMEKRMAIQRGWNESIFVNTRGELCEGTTTNLFFVKDGALFTPPVRCGLLDGVLRSHLMQQYTVAERIIHPHELAHYDELFVTNSLLGIMPVTRCGEIEFRTRTVADRLLREYRNRLPSL